MTEKKIKVINAARELFSRYGYKKVSMDAIAKKSLVTKKTIYTYFKDKDECIALVHNPDDLNELEEIQNRLKYEELFKFMFKINFLKFFLSFTSIIFKRNMVK